MHGIIIVQPVQHGVLYAKVRGKTAHIEFNNAEIFEDFIERVAVFVPALKCRIAVFRRNRNRFGCLPTIRPDFLSW
jgi:hypothetical protein